MYHCVRKLLCRFEQGGLQFEKTLAIRLEARSHIWFSTIRSWCLVKWKHRVREDFSQRLEASGPMTGKPAIGSLLLMPAAGEEEISAFTDILIT